MLHNPDIIYMYIVLSKVKNASLSHYKHCVSGMSYCCLTSNERLLSYIITNQSLFVLMPNSMVFGLSSPLIEPTTFSTWVEHTNIYVHNRAITAFMVTCVVARCFQYRKYSAFHSRNVCNETMMHFWPLIIQCTCIWYLDYDFGCLPPLSTIVKFFHDGQVYWWMKTDNNEGWFYRW
jgi:hypothetical protein